MKIEDILLEEMYSEDEESVENINEEFFPITPLLAFMSFKQSTFGKLKNKFVDLKKEVGKFARRKKAKALTTKEMMRADAGKKGGKGDDATVYKLRKPQMELMAKIYGKYGNEIVKDIFEFRKNILAPYSLIKRKIKESTRVTNKDKFGMTKAEFKAALESGRKKIENRGEEFVEKSEEIRERLNRINDQLDLLEQAQGSLNDEDAEIPRSILNRLYKEFHIDDKHLEGYSADELRAAHREMQKTVDDLSKKGTISKKEIVSKAKKKSSAKSSDDEDDYEDEESTEKKGSINLALSRYLFRKEIIEKVKDSTNPTVVRAIYTEIVREMINELLEKKRESSRKLRSLNKSIKFNEKEEKIWKKRKTASSSSSDLNDYYQAIKEEDFLEEPIYIKRTPELVEAEQKIENEIKRFERKLQKKISKEDFKELKKYRLINNLITVRDLKSSKVLFKDADEILSDAEASREDVKDSVNYMPPERFERRVWQIFNGNFTSMSELNNAKKELEQLVKLMRHQGEKEVLDRLSDTIEKIRARRTLQPTEFDKKYSGVRSRDFVDVTDIQQKAQEIINTEYDDINTAKRDKRILDELIDKFKEDNPDKEEQLSDIRFLLNRVETKLNREIG